MAQKLFSNSLQPFAGEINNRQLNHSLVGLKKFLHKRNLTILSWDKKRIAVVVTVAVELPPLGTFENIDIKEKERILIVIDLAEYPNVAPRVYPDRLDFPKDQLAHLYIASNGKPPAFCLVRGNLEEWYANKQLKDLIIRTENWLRDAVSGELTEDGNQFDPLRLEGYSGTFIYDYDHLSQLVNNRQSFYPEENFAVALFERKETLKGFSYKLSKIISLQNFKESYEDFKKEEEKDSSLTHKKAYHFGYIIWSENQNTYKNYSVELPRDWDAFKIFCERYGIALSFLEEQITRYDSNTYVGKPVIVAIKRPKNVIGFSGTIEFVNFCLLVDSTDVNEGKIINNISVVFEAHNQPLSIKKAKEISGFSAEIEKRCLVAGCGALGSKIIMHLARSGTTNFFLSDTDIVSPHNLVRHAVFANNEGVNKAIALAKEIQNIYPYEKQINTLPLHVNAEVFLSSEFAGFYSWVFDFTASNTFFLNLVNNQTLSEVRICKAFISDFGNLGILYFEGRNRNPRIDDLQIMLYAQYRKLESIRTWLMKEKVSNQNNINVRVGVGCNSETTVLSDDIVSLHSAYFSGIIKSETNKEQGSNGKVFLNAIHYEPFFHNAPKLLEVAPMVVLKTVNESPWQIRIKSGIIESIKKEMGYAMPSETGGVFIGTANYKTNVIHVVEIVKAPLDSKSNSVCFFRGIEGLPDTINEVNESTGNQLGYIGEWHTHPFGPNTMSSTDAATVRRFKNDFEKLQTPLPVFLMIVTPTHVLPFVF